jgi:hypothetical protein
MGKWKGLEKWEEEFGEKEGKKFWLEARRHKRKRTIEIIKTLSGISFLLKLIGR